MNISYIFSFFTWFLPIQKIMSTYMLECLRINKTLISMVIILGWHLLKLGEHKTAFCSSILPFSHNMWVSEGQASWPYLLCWSFDSYCRLISYLCRMIFIIICFGAWRKNSVTSWASSTSLFIFFAHESFVTLRILCIGFQLIDCPSFHKYFAVFLSGYTPYVASF